MDTEVVALLDELERRVTDAHSFWFGRVSLNRKAAKQLVKDIGDRLDIAGEATSGEPSAGLARTLIVQGFAELDFLVRHGGGGGAVYQIFVLDVSRKRILASIEMLRRGLQLHDREQSASGLGGTPIS
jgi:hypothetical protein